MLLQLLDHVLLSLSLNSQSPRALILLKKAMLSPWGGAEVAGSRHHVYAYRVL